MFCASLAMLSSSVAIFSSCWAIMRVTSRGVSGASAGSLHGEIILLHAVWVDRDAEKSQPKTLAGKLGGNAKRSVLRKKPGIGEKQTQKQIPSWGMLQTKTEDSKTGSRTTHIVPRETQHTDNSPREQGKGFWMGRQFYSVDGDFFSAVYNCFRRHFGKDVCGEYFIGSVTQ